MRREEEQCAGRCDFSTPATREATAARLYALSKAARAERECLWAKCEDYYRGRHGEELCVPDAFVHIESQVEPEVPDFVFRGRDGDTDELRARQREYAVKYVVEANDLAGKNTANERRLLKFGDAFWKVRWDQSLSFRGAEDGGDICVEDVDPHEIFPDPCAGELQQGEFLLHVYPMHRRRAARAFAGDLARLGLTVEGLAGEENGLSPAAALGAEQIGAEECVGVTEFYYRTEENRVALSVLLCGREIRHVPDFWRRTGGQNRRFPFVQYWRIRDETGIWNQPELAQVFSLIDAADRELSIAERNRALMANDMLVVEENALAEGCELTNEPGAVITMRPGRIDRVRRLCGLSSAPDAMAAMDRYAELIERAVGNYDSQNGKEPERVVTASGIELLNARADFRREIKRADRLRGFERLYELIDWFCLEFYDDDRMIGIGAQSAVGRRAGLSEDLLFRYSPSAKGEEIYFPRVDCMITATEPRPDRAAVLEILKELAHLRITPENRETVCALIRASGIPQAERLCEAIREVPDGGGL